ncbi:MAG: hypothetical protein R2754_13370 [Microthrixaceae bacterium]
MGEHKLVSCHPRPWRYCTQADGTPPASDLIRRDFNATEPGVRFVGDITQVDTWAGPGYLATVIDLNKAGGRRMGDRGPSPYRFDL